MLDHTPVSSDMATAVGVEEGTARETVDPARKAQQHLVGVEVQEGQ